MLSAGGIELTGRIRLVAALMLIAPAASAQSISDSGLRDCMAVQSESNRLACFDRAVAALREAAGSAPPPVEAGKQLEVEKFGIETLSPAAWNEKVAEEEEMQGFASTVHEMLKDARGRSVIIIENGQMWRQISGLPLPPVREGDAVRLERRSLGGYRMSFLRQKRSVPVSRVR